MQIHTPAPRLKEEGEFEVRVNDHSTPFAIITLSEDCLTSLYMESEADCDRLIRAACAAKDLLRSARLGKPGPLPAGAQLTPPRYDAPTASLAAGGEGITGLYWDNPGSGAL